jgi:mannose-6-phosphate isomerase
MVKPYPLLLKPILKEKVWGGRRLAALGKPLPATVNIGESWELADLAHTSPGGGGGAAEHSVILNGGMAGKTLRDAVKDWGPMLLANTKPTPDGGFPLLVKFLDARQNLSVQVHPSPAYLEAHPTEKAHLKTEAWYILDAEPNSVLYKGVKPGVSPAAFAKHVEQQTVVDDLIAVPAVPGEIHNLPSGTLHALGAGVLVAEIQTPSDTTFRVYDWEKELGRKGRELHLQQALECISFAKEDAPPPAASLPKDQAQGRLLITDYFTIDEARGTKNGIIAGGLTPACTILIMLAGKASLVSGTGQFDPSPMAAGMTVVLPAALAHRCFLRLAAPTKLLRVTVGKV